jgi:uncharacterized tellurite resistance protein B-like protein
MIALVVLVIVGAIIWGAVAYSKRRRRDARPDTPLSFTLEVVQSPTPTPCPTPTPRPTYSPMAWAGSGAVLRVSGYELADPLVYYSDGVSVTREPSCINTRLGVGTAAQECEAGLGYWPCYDYLSEAQRACYLSWLANGRKERAREIGYVFIFFYGLERRALVDEKDLDAIAAEVGRLLALHGDCSSFYISARTGRVPSWWNPAEDSASAGRGPLDEETLNLMLAEIHRTNKPLPADLAFEVARADIRSSRSVVATRVAEQFGELFRTKYSSKYGEGMAVHAAARSKLLYYHPASSLFRDSACSPERIPDVLGLQGQFKPIVEIWNECIEELRPLSRTVAKGAGINSAEAYFALPDAIRSITDHPDKDAWERFVQQHASDSNMVITQVSELAALCRYAVCEKLNRRLSEALAATATGIGFVIVPDPRTTGRPYGWEEPVALFRVEGTPADPTDKTYRAVVMMTEIGIAVAAVDGTIDREEATYISEFLSGQFSLNAEHARCTAVYRELLASKPPSLGDVARRLRGVLQTEQRETVGRFIVGVAAANKQVTKKEIAALRRLYTALGIDPAKLDEQITQLAGNLAQVIEIQGRSSDVATERIPPKAEVVFTLSPEALQKVMAETEQVAKILGEVLDKETDDGTLVPSAAAQQSHPTDSQPGVCRGLNAPYDRLVEVLLAQPEWTKEQFDKAARESGCMPAAAMETINTWADEAFGDYLIEEGETYKVNQALTRRT